MIILDVRTVVKLWQNGERAIECPSDSGWIRNATCLKGSHGDSLSQSYQHGTRTLDPLIAPQTSGAMKDPPYVKSYTLKHWHVSFVPVN
jgi:hypothetical protein